MFHTAGSAARPASGEIICSLGVGSLSFACRLAGWLAGWLTG